MLYREAQGNKDYTDCPVSRSDGCLFPIEKIFGSKTGEVELNLGMLLFIAKQVKNEAHVMEYYRQLFKRDGHVDNQ